jgi:hypothetical protein
MTKLVRLPKGADVIFQLRGVRNSFSNSRGSWVNPDDIASVVLLEDGRCWMQMRSAKGEITFQVDDVEKFERDLGLIVESEPDVEQVREPKETEAEKVRTFNEYYNAYYNKAHNTGDIGATEKAVRAVLDLAGVKYTD